MVLGKVGPAGSTFTHQGLDFLWLFRKSTKFPIVKTTDSIWIEFYPSLNIASNAVQLINHVNKWPFANDFQI
jgi:hypothetical protein